jgi:hypothetical protein
VVTIGDPLGLAVVTCGGYDRRRLAVVEVGFDQERALHTPICWWLWICWCGGSRWVGVDGCGLLVRRLSVSFPVGMVGCEDVCEIFGECDLLLGLDCGVGHGGEGVGLWWSGEGWWRRVFRLLNAK